MPWGGCGRDSVLFRGLKLVLLSLSRLCSRVHELVMWFGQVKRLRRSRWGVKQRERTTKTHQCESCEVAMAKGKEGNILDLEKSYSD